MLEKVSQAEQKDNLITLYPFNGRSSYLIDKFYIMGYNYIMLKKLLIDNTPNEIEKAKDKGFKEPLWGSFTLEEDPIILNEIANDYDKECLPSQSLLQMVFPHKLKCFYTWEANTNNFNRRLTSIDIGYDNDDDDKNNDFTKIEFRHSNIDAPLSSKVIFSINPQTDKKKDKKESKNGIANSTFEENINGTENSSSKKSINGIANIFYRKFKDKKILNKKKFIYYVPYCFCITSEYPYFTNFNKLFTIIKKFFSQKSIYIPIEILIYNIISLTPSPLNSDIILDLNGLFTQDEIFSKIKEELLDSKNVKKKSDKANNYSNISKKFIKEFDKDNIPESGRLSIYSNKNIRGVKIKNWKKEGPEDYKIEFKFLSGYPLIQYNLPEVLFRKLSIEQIITIFIYMFLEKDVLFFSKDIEFLTLTINAYLNLSFPLNDEKYYFIGCAISLDDYINGKSNFGAKGFSSIIGINDSFDKNYRRNDIIKDHLAVDLDNKNIIFGDYPDDRASRTRESRVVNENNKQLVKLIDNMCKETIGDEKTQSLTLYQSIKNLNRSLKTIYNKIYNIQKRSIPEELLFFNEKISKYNKVIQESFYQFIQYICLYFYMNLTIRTQEELVKSQKNKINNNLGKGKEEPEMIVIFNEQFNENNKYNEIELMFLNELRETMKYESFVKGFLQNYDPIDLYKIPLTFTEEFLSIISRKKEENKHNYSFIKFFDLIDSLYLKGKKYNPKDINFVSISYNYFRIFKNKIDREIFDNSKNKYNLDDTNLVKFIPNEKKLIYQTYELDDNIIMNYIHLIKLFTLKEYVDCFPNTFYVEANMLDKINPNNIETLIENYCIKENILNISDICCANILLLFTISLKSLRNAINCQEFLGILFQSFTIFRKYHSILLKMIFKLIQISEKARDYSTIANTAICYFPCINAIRNKLVPNEDLMKIISQFNQINILECLQLKDDKNKKKEKEIIPEDIKLYGEQLKEIDITEDNLYAIYNYSFERFYKEKEIVDYVNKTNQFEMMINDNVKIFPRIRFNNGIHKIESLFLSQKEMLDNLVKEIEKYIETFDDSKLNSKLILDSCLNIFIYMRNDEKLVKMDNISSALQSIFYIFMNQLFILKAKKEKMVKQN